MQIGTDSRRIELLDWLRAYGALIVMLGHADRVAAPGGAVGVSVFFALSGYLISSILLSNGMLTIHNILIFYIRRLGRIYPMYLLIIAFMGVYFFFFSPIKYSVFSKDLFSILTLTGEPSEWLGYGFGVLWTLFVEFWFYITFPFFVWLGLRFKRILSVFFVLILISFMAKIFQSKWTLVLYYDHFVLGALVAALVKLKRTPFVLRHKSVGYIGLGLIILAATVPYPGARNLFWYAQSLSAALGTSLIIIFYLEHGIKVSVPWISFMGKISYSMYLLHAVILDGWLKLKFAPNLPLFLITVVALSTLTYRYVEEPTIRYVHRVARFEK